VSRRAIQNGVLVLGMHRSGTSVATRLVNLLGPSMCVRGDLVTSAPWNPKGSWESRSLMRVNDRLLARAGRSWWYPPPDGDEYWSVTAGIEEFSVPSRHAFERVHPVSPWVWKDPRIALLVPFWRQVLGPTVGVLVYRSPLDVAISLRRRHSVPLRFGVALWERYNRLLLRHCEGMPMTVVRYEDLVEDPSTWIERLRQFLARFSIGCDAHPGQSDLRDVVDPELRHSDTSSTELRLHPEAHVSVATYEVLEATVGSSTCFESPRLPPEPPSVEHELASMRPPRRLHWNVPPAADLDY
jgi:hypothetical protein